MINITLNDELNAGFLHIDINKDKKISTIINMSGGIMQLVAYGAQDVYLTGKSTNYIFSNSL